MYDEIVKKIMKFPFDYEWELQGFGMLRTYIDKYTRLQIWLKDFIIPNVTDIHTHPWDFKSFIYQGQIRNNIFFEYDPQNSVSGEWFQCDKCLILTGENAYVKERTPVILKPNGSFEYSQGDLYHHGKDIPHRIDFIDGTITILTKSNIHEDSLAYSYVKGFENEWVSAAPRPATKEEIKAFIEAARKLNQKINPKIPTIVELLAQCKEASSIFMVDEEASKKEFDKIMDNFNENYKIVPKEQWCVLFYKPWDGGDPEVTGPFNSEEEAKLFIENWEAKREGTIEQYLIDNPNKDIDDIPSGPILVAKKLKFNNTNQEIIDKIRKVGIK